MFYDSALEAALRQDREMNRLRAAYDSPVSIANRIAMGLGTDHGGLGPGITSAELARVLADPLADQKHILASTASAIMMAVDRQTQQRELAESLVHQRAMDAVRDATHPAADYLRRIDELNRLAARADYHEDVRRIASGRYGDSASAWVESGLWQPPSQSLLGGARRCPSRRDQCDHRAMAAPSRICRELLGTGGGQRCDGGNQRRP